MNRRTAAIGSGLVWAALPLLLACSDSATGPALPPPLPEAPVASIAVVPSTLTLDMGETSWVSAVLSDAEGEVVRGDHRVAWSSSNPGLVLVSDGTERALVRAVAPGSVTLTARYGEFSSVARVTVIFNGFEPGGEGEIEVERHK